MSLDVPDELIIEGVARSVDRWIDAHPEMGAQLLERMAELRCELLTKDETAGMLSITPDVLRKNWRAYGLTKSTALGPNEPRFFRSQVVEAMQREGKVLEGQLPRVEEARASLAKKVTPFPRRAAPTICLAKGGGG